MKMDRLVLETTMEMILCMFESCDTEEFTEIFGTLLPYAVEKNNDLFIVKDYLLYIRHDFGHVKSRRQNVLLIMHIDSVILGVVPHT